MVCLEASEMQIRVLWGTQFITPSFVRPTLEAVKVLVFARNIGLGWLLAIVVILPEWLTPIEVEVLLENEMEVASVRLSPGHTRLAKGPAWPERVSVPMASLSLLSLVHLLIVYPFFLPKGTCTILAPPPPSPLCYSPIHVTPVRHYTVNPPSMLRPFGILPLT